MMLLCSRGVYTLSVCSLRGFCTMLLGSLTMLCLLSPGVWAVEGLETPALVSWAIAVEDVVERHPDHRLLVDVRPAQAFEQFRIPGSLNIPLFALRTKAFLRSSPVVLLDEGYRPGRLQQACEQLRQAGFEVWYLAGGLHAWKTADQPLQGDVFARQRVNRLPPQALWEALRDAAWLIIDVSDPPVHSSDKEATDAFHRISCPYSGADTATAFRFCLEMAVTSREEMPEWSVVLANEQGAGYDKIAHWLQTVEFGPVWYLEGGLSAYRHFLTRQAQIRAGSASTSTACTAPSGCRPCE